MRKRHVRNIFNYSMQTAQASNLQLNAHCMKMPNMKLPQNFFCFFFILLHGDLITIYCLKANNKSKFFFPDMYRKRHISSINLSYKSSTISNAS